MVINVLSYGGGIQSTALLVLAARGSVKIDAAIYVDLDTENPATTRYVNEVAESYCQRIGIEFIKVKVSLMSMIEDNPAFPPVPFRDQKGMFFGRRLCTNHAKVRPFRRALRALMRVRGARHARVLLGISADEIERMRDSDVRYITYTYPLIDLNMDRAACENVIAAELPIPKRSHCWFCPFASGGIQREIIRENPHLARQAAELQERVDKARQTAGADRLMIIRFDPDQLEMFEVLCGGMCHV